MARSEWIAFVPRDTVLVRDGRQFDAGADVAAEPTVPGPSTLAGATFAAYGGRTPEPDAVRGPLLARRVGDDTWEGMFPVPADLMHPDDDNGWVRRLRPEPLLVTTDLSGECPQWLVGGGGPVTGWMSADALSAYLTGGLLGDGDDREIAIDELDVAFGPGAADEDPLVRERRVGLARTEHRVARDGFLYQATHLRPVDGVALLTECDLPEGWHRTPRGPVPLGGRGRLADVERVATGVTWPVGPKSFPGGRVLVYVATPAIWPGGWRIPVPDGARLVAAAVGPSETVATASPRLGMEKSRALRWAVPAGSVYLLAFDGPDGPDRASRWARDVCGKAYGRDGRDRLRTAGFGVVLTGVWS